MEFYVSSSYEGFEVPVIFDNQNLLTKARKHLEQNDYKAAAVYVRTAFEKIIRHYCEKKKKAVVFKSKLNKYTTEDFWNVMKEDIDPDLKAKIETYRSLVLNPFCHYNTERHEIRTELEKTIQMVTKLKNELK
jgi:hypothetical protein